ncbi:tubby C-terminal-like domain-containing protein [Mycena rebaudengoi]|nr:tubby C-terminal-like domain-containing protein [Mycena rebaudengoi]
MTTPQHLQSFPQIGIFPQFCARQQMTLVLQEKAFSFSGDNFSVKDQGGNTVVKCDGKALSWSDKKVFTDAAGNHLFDLKTKHFHIHKTFEAEDAAGNVILTVQGRFKLIGSKMAATFRNAADGREIELICKGSFLDRKAEITMDDQVVAEIARSFFNAREIFGDKQTYQVSVAPGMDLALMAAICICLDEKENEKVKGVHDTIGSSRCTRNCMYNGQELHDRIAPPCRAQMTYIAAQFPRQWYSERLPRQGSLNTSAVGPGKPVLPPLLTTWRSYVDGFRN